MLDNAYLNPSIHCTVAECKHNNGSENYCSLESIKVGTHEANPTDCRCTDCKSFEPKCGCSG